MVHLSSLVDVQRPSPLLGLRVLREISCYINLVVVVAVVVVVVVAAAAVVVVVVVAKVVVVAVTKGRECRLIN